ncbi:MAG TPA: T9SS type A sorting domain-containing protein [Cyclobacteriaceae bacterium]
MRGEGLNAPAIAVSPDSLVQSLYTDRTATQQLTIQNNGGSDLHFSVHVRPQVTASQITKEITLSSQQSSANVANLKQTEARSNHAGTVQIKSVSQSSVAAHVLIVTPDSNVDDLKTVLNSFSDIQANVFPVDSLPMISLTDLTGYDVVITTNNGQWQATGHVAPDVIGDLLADYIDHGGKVIVNEFAYSYDAWRMTGRFMEQQYGPFISSTADANIEVTLDSMATSNPIMQGVTTLNYSGFVQNVGLAPGAAPLARWSNGDLFAAANTNVVALNILPSLGTGGALPWNGDLPTFYQNAIHWLTGPSFIRVSPSAGTVAAGSQTNLDVLFDASSLVPGSYQASLDITTNVPAHELISIPAALHVLGPEFSITPDSIAVALGKDESTTQTIVLTNNGSDSKPFTVRVQGKNGASASSVKLTSLKTNTSSTARQQTQPIQKRNKVYNGPALNEGTQSLQTSSGFAAARTSAAQNTTVTYSTDFESFSPGDINGQQGWEGQYGNWTIDSSDPVSGVKHFHALADGLGQSLAFSPVVSIGTEHKSTTTMKINVQGGGGVTWQVIPQSPSAGFLNTRVEFSANGSARALVNDGAGSGYYLPINATIPSGYFDLTIEVDRDSATFNIFFNNTNVFHGLGFANDIEQVVFLSLMETAGPVLDVDDFQILDGARDTTPAYITVSPVSGTIAAGESIALTATFNSAGLEFGKYHADIVVDIADLDELIVPTTLSVIGDPAIEVNPTVLQAVVGYKEDTIRNFKIKNTGGSDLYYGLTVIGANTDVATLPPSPVNKFSVTEGDARVQQKIKKDQALSPALVNKQPSIELLSGTSLLEQRFDSVAFPPAGWTYRDNTGSGVVWKLASAWGEGNYSGVGNAATVSSDAFGEAEFDTELISPSINVSSFSNIVVQYSANYQNFARLDYLDLDIKVDSASWVNVLRWNEDHGAFRRLPGEFVSIHLDSLLAGANSFKLRWHYYDPNTDDYDWYAQIDNVVVLGDPRPWLTVSPASGVIPVGEDAMIAAHFHSKDLDPGLYVAGILVNSNAVTNPLVGIVASLQVLNPAVIEVSPANVNQELTKGQTASQTVLISNHGESSLKFTIDGIAIQGAPNKTTKRIAALEKRTTSTAQKISLSDPTAIAREKKTFSMPLYATGFEEFSTGDINGQGDWLTQFGNWTVEQINPYSGAQHFRGVSDGLGQSVAFSPQVSPGTDAISSATMHVDLSSASGTTWQIIPQSPTANFVNTKIQISPDGTLQALVADSLGNASFVNISTPAPAGYFDLKIEVMRATAVFSLFFNNIKVFDGQGFAGDIEELVIFSLMESNGPVLDIDNLAILDGRPQAPWIVVDPTAGTVPANSSLPVTVFFDARDLAAGSYYDTLRVHSNDPVSSSVSLPVYLHVTENRPPVIAAIADTTVVEGQTIELTFTATDPDDSLINVSLATIPSFVTLKNKTTNAATYTAKPVFGNAGDYRLVVTATDAHGGVDSAAFYLHVIPYGVRNFSLINVITNEVIADFDDSITVDVAHPDYTKLNIRANTNPSKVGSVIFAIDGAKKNTENIAPYDLRKSAFNVLGLGSHALHADAFTKINGKGIQGKGKGAVITVMNLSIVTEFDIVNTSGQVLQPLHNNDTINIGNAAYHNITIVANVGNSKVGSIVFGLNGSRRIENIPPYALNGDKNGYYKPWPFVPGQYFLQATTYSKGYGRGKIGGTNSVLFWIVDTDSLGVDDAFRSSISAQNDMLQNEQGLSVYPVPVSDELQLTLNGKESIVEVQIINSTGQVFYRTGKLDSVKHFTISTTKIGLISGMYLVQTINNNGRREVKKFVKE